MSTRDAVEPNPLIKTRPIGEVTEKGLLSAISDVSENETVPSARYIAVNQARDSGNSTSET